MADTDKKKKRRSPAKWFKELFSELKKVTWPTFPQVVKQTGIVLFVTLLFLLVLMGMDALLGYLYKLLITGLNKESLIAMSLLSGAQPLSTFLGAFSLL
ncbi:MAG: preprotein translocase subunit SecE [Clostridia bacterium]|jgi:preprotein translocase subunit SecE|nr:preprotein translocase subunit SecE [Clostridia bacterium]